MFGFFVETLFTTGWGQPAIGILSTVCDPAVRGTSVSMFFFLVNLFQIYAPRLFIAMDTHFGINP